MIFRKCHFIRYAAKTARGPKPDSIRSEPGIAVYMTLDSALNEQYPVFIIPNGCVASEYVVNVWDVIRVEPDTLVQL